MHHLHKLVENYQGKINALFTQISWKLSVLLKTKLYIQQYCLPFRSTWSQPRYIQQYCLPFRSTWSQPRYIQQYCLPFRSTWSQPPLYTAVLPTIPEHMISTPLYTAVLLTIPEHMISTPVFSEIRVAWSLIFYVVFNRSLFVLFLLAIELSVILRFTASDYPKIFINAFIMLINWFWRQNVHI
jgi:hypothetical protein